MTIETFFDELQAECGLYKTGYILFNSINPEEYRNMTLPYVQFLSRQPILIEVQQMSSTRFYIRIKNRIGQSIDSYYDVRTANLLELKNAIKNACLEIKEYRYKKKLDDIKKDFE